VTIFDYLKDILVTKRGDLVIDQYVPFLVNRWLSFLNPTICETINSTVNCKTLLENKELHYKTMIAIFPKARYAPRINYVKKIKEKEQDDDVRVKVLAQNLEISEREALLLVSGLN
jgi:hypothetical protein